MWREKKEALPHLVKCNTSAHIAHGGETCVLHTSTRMEPRSARLQLLALLEEGVGYGGVGWGGETPGEELTSAVLEGGFAEFIF